MKHLNWYLRNAKRKVHLAYMEIRFIILMLTKPIGTTFEYRHRRVSRFVYIHSILTALKTI